MFFSKRRSAPLLGQAAYLFLNVIFLGCVLGLVLTLLFVRNGAMRLYEGRAGDLVTRAVMKPTISDEQAHALAERLRAGTSGLVVTTIGHTEARALLALQEPWMRELPDIEIGTLPVMLEIRHPELLTAPTKVLAFNESLERETEVEFVMFNSLGYENLVRFGKNVKSYSSFLCAAAALLLAVCYVLFNFVISGLRGNISFMRAVINTVLTLLGALVLAVVLYQVVARIGGRIYSLAGLPFSAYLAVITGAAVIVFLLEIKNVRLGHRRVVDIG